MKSLYTYIWVNKIRMNGIVTVKMHIDFEGRTWGYDRFISHSVANVEVNAIKHSRSPADGQEKKALCLRRIWAMAAFIIVDGISH